MQMLQQVVYPLHEACATNDLQTVSSLLKTGPGTSNGLMTFDVDAKDFEGWTPLHAAIQRGHVEVVRKLLGARCKIDATHWNMALEQLRPHEAHSTFARVVKVLQQHAYPMHFACAKGLTEDVDQLLRQNLDVNQKDWKGRTPLHEASKKGHMTLAQKLLAAGADMHAKDGKGCSPCHLAVIWAELDGTSAQTGNEQICEKILSLFQQFGASIMEEMLSYGNLRLQGGEVFFAETAAGEGRRGKVYGLSRRMGRLRVGKRFRGPVIPPIESSSCCCTRQHELQHASLQHAPSQ